MSDPFIKQLQSKIAEFAKERDWEQYHTPKNLVMALSVEASELLEHFQWLTEEQSQNLTETQKSEVADEISDVLVYLVRLASVLEIDIEQSVERKMHKNGAKYPAEKVKGSIKKYHHF